MTGAAPFVSVETRLRRGDFTLDAAFVCGGGITALHGPSGSGKTTILNLIAGLQTPDRGRIAIGDRVLTDTASRVHVPRHKRRVGLVHQDALLFPHMSVRQNIGFGRWFSAVPPSSIGAETILGIFGISHLLDRRPSTLSGGEKQRVALARAILAAPGLLLLDEPLASLDDERREEILPLIERLRDEFHVPMIYVTHRSDEVERLASAVIRMDRGRVVAQGPARTIF